MGIGRCCQRGASISSLLLRWRSSNRRCRAVMLVPACLGQRSIDRGGRLDGSPGRTPPTRGRPCPENRPWAMTKSPSATMRSHSYLSVGGRLLIRLKRPSRPALMCALCWMQLGDQKRSAAAPWRGRLPHLDQMAIRVSDVRADLAAMVLWLGEKLRASGRPFLVRLLNIRHPDVHEGAGAVRVGRGGQGHGRLVIRRPAADVQDDPGVGDLHDHGIALDEHLAVEDLFVEFTGTILV